MRQLLGRVERKHDFTAILLIYFVVLYVHLKKQFSIMEINKVWRGAQQNSKYINKYKIKDLDIKYIHISKYIADVLMNRK